jgi:hypothetical protein
MRRGVRRSRTQPPLEPEAYPEEIARLLHDVASLRTTMTSDLSAAAAAVDSDEPGVARDIIEGDRRDLAGLGQRPESSQPSPNRPRRHRQPASRPRTGRRSVLAATVPLLATAVVGAALAAGYAVHRGAVPAPQSLRPTQVVPAQRAAPTDHAAIMLRALTRDVRRGASPATISATAALLHDELASIAATAGGNSRTLATVRAMLAAEDRLLSGFTDPRVATELRAVRALEASLAAAPPAHAGSTLPTPGSTTLPGTPLPATPLPATPRSSISPTHRAVPKTPAPQPVRTPTTPPTTTAPPLPVPTIPPTLPGIG